MLVGWKSRQNWWKRAADVFGGLDAVVANAGIANPSSLAEVELEDWERMFNVNLRGPWLLAKAAFPHLSKSKGCLVTVSSMSGRTPHAGSGAYSPAKAALTMLSKTLAIEWAPDGVRCEYGLAGNDMDDDVRSNV